MILEFATLQDAIDCVADIDSQLPENAGCNTWAIVEERHGAGTYWILSPLDRFPSVDLSAHSFTEYESIDDSWYPPII